MNPETCDMKVWIRAYRFNHDADERLGSPPSSEPLWKLALLLAAREGHIKGDCEILGDLPLPQMPAFQEPQGWKYLQSRVSGQLEADFKIMEEAETAAEAANEESLTSLKRPRPPEVH
jgi:hypothetical protein